MDIQEPQKHYIIGDIKSGNNDERCEGVGCVGESI